MTILGIDTSLRSSGYGVLSVEGSRMRSLEHGTIKNAPKVPLSECLKHINARVEELIERHNPDVLSIESVIYAKNAATRLVLGEARGAVITAAAKAGKKFKGAEQLAYAEKIGLGSRKYDLIRLDGHDEFHQAVEKTGKRYGKTFEELAH